MTASEPTPELASWHTTMRSRLTLGRSTDMMPNARQVLARWLQDKWKPLRDERASSQLAAGESFSLEDETTTLQVTSANGSWAFELDQPDRQLSERYWVTRVCLKPVEAGVELQVENGYWAHGRAAVWPTVPIFMRELVHQVGGWDADARVWDEPRVVDRASRFEEFEELLLSAHRALPVLVMTPFNRSGQYPADALLLARHLLGVAHVVLLDDMASRWLSQTLGESLEVYNGAARLYRPGLLPGQPAELHSLFLPPRSAREDPFRPHRGFTSYLQDQAFALAVSLLPALPGIAKGEAPSA